MSNSGTTPETILDFQERFASEEACEAYLFSWRWPDGFRCPRCNHDEATKLSHRRQYQCRGCKYQVSITAGTAMHNTKLSLRVWFWAIFLVARHKKSISALQLQKDLGLGSYRSAWLLLQKVRRCFGEKDEYPLKGIVEVDETLVGAKGKGAKPGKDPGNKAILVAAVAIGDRTKRGHRWKGVRARVVPDYKGKSLAGFVTDVVKTGSTVVTDGWRAYDRLADSGFELRREVSSKIAKRDMRVANPMPHVHLFFSNFKTWITGRFHGVSHKYMGRYADEFVYRVNRRFSPPEIFGWLARRLMQGTPCSLAGITAAEAPT